MKKQKEIIVGILILVVGFFVGIISAIIVVESSIPSSASNDGWLGFLGGLFGSIISGLVAYFILYENRKDMLSIQIEQERQNNYQIRKRFVDDIAEEMAAYITDICNYCYNQYLNKGQHGDKKEKFDRRIAVEKYYLLHMKLYKIEEAKTLLRILDRAHRECFDMNSIYEIEKYDKIIDELNEESKKFIYEYALNGGNQ